MVIDLIAIPYLFDILPDPLDQTIYADILLICIFTLFWILKIQ